MEHKTRKTILLLGFILSFSAKASAADFNIEFDWSNLKKCTSGNPNTVSNPTFALNNVPNGTK